MAHIPNKAVFDQLDLLGIKGIWGLIGKNKQNKNNTFQSRAIWLVSKMTSLKICPDIMPTFSPWQTNNAMVSVCTKNIALCDGAANVCFWCTVYI